MMPESQIGGKRWMMVLFGRLPVHRQALGAYEDQPTQKQIQAMDVMETREVDQSYGLFIRSRGSGVNTNGEINPTAVNPLGVSPPPLCLPYSNYVDTLAIMRLFPKPHLHKPTFMPLAFQLFCRWGSLSSKFFDLGQTHCGRTPWLSWFAVSVGQAIGAAAPSLLGYSEISALRIRD